METNEINEVVINEGAGELNQSEQIVETDINNQQNRKKYHSSAMYAASMWHSTVKHVRPPHIGGSFLPWQA